MIPIWWQPDAFTKVTVFDISGGEPRVESETLVAGQYQNARRIGDSVRLVLRRNLRWPQLQYYPQNVEWNTPEFEIGYVADVDCEGHLRENKRNSQNLRREENRAWNCDSSLGE